MIVGFNNGYYGSGAKHARFIGVSGSCPSSQVTNIDLSIPDTGRWITGSEYEVGTSNFGDHVKFQIVHPQSGVVEEFASNIFVFSDPRQYITYPGWIPSGLILRVEYTNIGPNDSSIVINHFLHMDEEPPE